MEYTPPPFFQRGPGLLARLSFFALLSLVLLYADARFHYMEGMRKAVGVVLYPLQRIVDVPGELVSGISSFFVSQSYLQLENERLARENFLNAGLLQTQQEVIAENRYLRQLLDMKARVGPTSTAAEILYFGRDPFSRKVIIDKGSSHKVVEGAAVIDDTGLIGQVSRTFPWTAEVALITDREQTVPVQVVRNGLRAAIFGTGYDGALDLRFMPVNAEIEDGDVLVTSGIDGVYPQGLPVAQVAHVERNAAQLFARITCTPLAGVANHTHVLIVSGNRELPPQPAEEPKSPRPRKSRKG